jgi:hypothetical protein
MKRYIRLFILLTIVLCFSCEEQGWIVRCPDCTANEPDQASLEIKFDDPQFGNTVMINIYEGDLEDSVLYKTYYVSGTKTTVPVTLNKRYTVTATYYIPDNYYIAVDSAYPRVRYDKNTCDDPCYFVYDKIVDVRLRYTK